MKHSEHGPDGPRDEASLFRHDLSALDEATAGDVVIARAWKYNGQAHYVVPGRYLGADGHGHWVWQAPGSLVTRPGLAFLAERGALMLLPHKGDWIATFHPRTGEGAPNWFIYCDVSMMITASPIPIPLSTPGEFGRGFEIDSFDMDLDVVRSRTRGVFIDDEDEFLEHGGRFAYPIIVVDRMRASADALAARLSTAEPPFDDPSPTFESWWRTAQTMQHNPMETP